MIEITQSATDITARFNGPLARIGIVAVKGIALIFHGGFMNRRKDAVEKHFVSFRKLEADRPACWIEVTIVAPRREAVRKAQELVRPIAGLLYEGVD